MIDFKLTNAMDLDDNGKDFIAVGGAEEIVQRIRTRLLTSFGEWEFDRRLGFQYVGSGGMFDTSVPKTIRIAMIRKYIADTEGVEVVYKFDVVIDDENRAINVAFEAKTTEGIVTFNEEITP